MIHTFKSKGGFLVTTTEECISSSIVCASLTKQSSFYLQPCVQYWPEPGLQQYGPMEVEFLSMSADEDVITRLFRVKNVTRVSHFGAKKACSGHVVPLSGILQIIT